MEWCLRGKNGKGNAYRYYACSGYRNRGKHICGETAIRSEKLEQVILGRFVRRLHLAQPPKEFRKWVEQALKGALGRSISPKETEMMRTEIAKVDAMAKALVNSVSPENLSFLDSKLTQLRQRKEQLESSLTQADARGRAEISLEDAVTGAMKQLQNLRTVLQKATPQELKQLLRGFIGEIRISRSNRLLRIGWYPLAPCLTSSYRGDWI